MSEQAVARPWLSTTAAGLGLAVDKLRKENPEGLLAFLLRAAASGEWETFIIAFERAARIRGLKLLLPAPDGFPMRYAYERAGLPLAEWPTFLNVLQTATAVTREHTGKVRDAKRLRDLVLERAGAYQALPDAIRTALAG